jgi:hypothetical protein
MNILNRNSTTINIATFWENYQLSKYNFTPPYQRPSDVWSQMKQSFLIDTVLKNFPMPPIFLHQHIEQSTGKTMYDVIDGKQRLGAIIAFIENKISTPENFNSDDFGDDKLDGIYFKDLESSDISNWKKTFWRYELTIEYIDTDQISIVNNIFDRLNRNGEPLTRQELRNAKFHSTPLYILIKKLADLPDLQVFFEKIQKNRLEHQEIVSELLFAMYRESILTGDNQDAIDNEYTNCIESTDFNHQIDQLEVRFRAISETLTSLNLEFAALKIDGLSHLYALWYLSYLINSRTLEIPDLTQRLTSFYTSYRQSTATEEMISYKISMSSNTKSKSSRSRRVNALLDYLQLGFNI